MSGLSRNSRCAVQKGLKDAPGRLADRRQVVVAGVAEAQQTEAVELRGVEDLQAVVGEVGDAVPVAVQVEEVDDLVTVEIVVAGVPGPVLVEVRLVGIGVVGAVVLPLGDPVAVRVLVLTGPGAARAAVAVLAQVHGLVAADGLLETSARFPVR